MSILGPIILFIVVGIFGFIGKKIGFTFRASILFFFGILAGISFIDGFDYSPMRNFSWAFIAGAFIDRFIALKLNKSVQSKNKEETAFKN
jgi:hypothetical protein